MGQKYNNPFMWNLFRQTDFINFVSIFDELNLKNISSKIDQDSPMNKNTNVVSINIDGKIEVPFVHHHVDSSCHTIKCINSDIYYDNMEIYVKEQFLKRVSRMTNDVVFLMMSSQDGMWKFLELETRHDKILVTSKKEVMSNESTTVIYDDFSGTTFDKAKRIVEKYGYLFGGKND